MKADKPLPNKCELNYMCGVVYGDTDCVYFRPQKKYPLYCKHDHNRAGRCYSLVAQTNAMVLALQDMGFEVQLKGGKK